MHEPRTPNPVFPLDYYTPSVLIVYLCNHHMKTRQVAATVGPVRQHELKTTSFDHCV